MTTDYKSRLNRKQKKPLPGYLWLLSGLTIGLFVAFIVYLDKQPKNSQDFGSAVQAELDKLKQPTVEQKTTTTPAAGKTAITDAAVTEQHEIKFNFYTLLPELEVLIPESETRPPNVNTRASTSTESRPNASRQAQTDKQYILQVGSFQNVSDAERLKANLAFLGVTAGIQHVTINNQQWHRVRTGPYPDRQQLFQKQRLLQQNDIHSISMEMK